ncbi:MAG TPA: RsmE family RNA methyltransferase [Chloroflexota bacterium]
MAHRFWVAAEQLAGERVRFTDEQARQLQHVLRLRAGDEVRVFDGKTRVDRLVRLREDFEGLIVGEAPQAPEPRTCLVVYPALLQRDKFELVLQKLTELGVSAIAPVLTARSLVREAPDERRVTRWRAILREAAEQCGRGVVPELLPAAPLAKALENAAGRLVMASVSERCQALPAALADLPQQVALFVGPEGGFTPEEVRCAREAGASVVTLGPRVLRAETAALLAAGLVLYELGDLWWPQSTT